VLRNRLDNLSGHAWTILPTLRHRVVAAPIPRSVEWSTTVDEAEVGEVVVRGRYAQAHGDTLVVLIHGLGGTPDSAYHVPVAQAAGEKGWSSLRLALRGTNGIGNDFYHAGLTADFHHAMRDDTFASYERVFVVGFSLGGHITMCLATEDDTDPRVKAVAAVCPPVDLSAGATMLDAPGQFVYRHHILSELRALYRGVAKTANVPTPWDRIKRVRKLREWDALTVVPRFGFYNVEDYYQQMAMANRIEQLQRPTLMIHSHHDPVVIPHTVYPVIERAPDIFEAHWIDGAGHVFFPPTLDIGVAGRRGLGDQVLGWLDRAG
jgi:predicted alpha/beta-fold hydrolase